MGSLPISDNKTLILKQFRERLKDIIPENHDDRYLLRWLKARNFDLNKAETMLRNDLKFRRKHGFFTMLEHAPAREEVLPYERSGFLGFDKDGRTIRLLNLNNGDIKGYFHCVTPIEALCHVCWFMEYDLRSMVENNKKTGKNADKFIFIYDFNGMRVRQLLDKLSIQRSMMVLSFFQDHYPECLHAVYVINVPEIFSYVYSTVKPILDEAVQKKVKIYSNNWEKDVFQAVPRDMVPAYLGGTRYEPPGDPMCHGILKWNDKVPTSLYLKEFTTLKRDDPGVKEKIIAQRSYFTEEVEVTRPGSKLCWIFETTDYNIKFGLFFTTKSNKSASRTDSLMEMETLLPVEPTESHTIVERDEFICKRPGIYVLYFDNTYSWVRSKHLLYKINVKYDFQADEDSNITL